MPLSQTAFEYSGWSRIKNSIPDLDEVSRHLQAAGVVIETLDLRTCAKNFLLFRHLAEYDGEYRVYGGALEHCLWEKALEHYLSFLLLDIGPGSTVLDIGSCRSVVPALVRRIFRARCIEQDLEYPAGLHDDRIGSNADSIPMPAHSVDGMTLHCTFEHFEGRADTGFVHECARLLKPGARTVILPLYLNRIYCNVTGETDEARRETIGWDSDAAHYCVIPEWQNRFGRHYSADAFLTRVHQPALDAGLRPKLIRVQHWDVLHPSLWLRWVLVLEQPAVVRPPAK